MIEIGFKTLSHELNSRYDEPAIEDPKEISSSLRSDEFPFPFKGKKKKYQERSRNSETEVMS